jgi:steroid delta-isomerase-like uncharacterized protein
VDPATIVSSIFDDAWTRQVFDSVAEPLREFEFHIRGTSRTMDVDELRAIIADWHIAFPDLRFDVEAMVVSGDRAAVHATLRGTHRGPWQGRPATGRSIDVEHMFFFRFDGDRIVEVWELLDSAQLQDQLGT